MITRIEIDGFKSFLDFQLDIPPLLALVGPNSSGKSNLFDAVDYDLAAGRGRSALLESRRGRPHELFHRGAEGSVDRFSITVHRLIQMGERIVVLDSCSGAKRQDGRPAENGYSILAPGEGQEKWAASAIGDRLWHGFGAADEDSGAARADFRKHLDLLFDRNERHYEPDPQAMRGRAPSADLLPLTRNGANLAAVLGRMRDSEAFGELAVDLAALIPDVVEIVPELDDKRQEWAFDLVIDGQGPVPSSLLSDGTLRILGLLAALHDPDHPGVLMVEEIENGLHPSRLAELLRRISELVTDLNDPESLDRPLRQVILTTHSPVVVSELHRMRPDSLVFLDTAVRVDPEHDRVSRVTVAKPVRTDGEPGTYVSPRQVRKYLSAVRQDTP
jgi:predicted ATPase